MTLLRFKILPSKSVLFHFCPKNSINLKSTQKIIRHFSNGKLAKMEGKKRIAVCQMTATGDREKNMSVVSNLIENASKEHAQV